MRGLLEPSAALRRGSSSGAPARSMPAPTLELCCRWWLLSLCCLGIFIVQSHRVSLIRRLIPEPHFSFPQFPSQPELSSKDTQGGVPVEIPMVTDHSWSLSAATGDLWSCHYFLRLMDTGSSLCLLMKRLGALASCLNRRCCTTDTAGSSTEVSAMVWR